MKKFIFALAIGILLVPQASFAAITPVGTDAQYKTAIATLTLQLQALTARVSALESQKAGTPVKGTAAPDVDSVSLEKEMKKLMSKSSWKSCSSTSSCVKDIKRVNEIRSLLNNQESCGYDVPKKKGKPVLICA